MHCTASAGNAYRRDPTGAAGTNVGDEIDFVANFHLARYSDLLLGYSRLFGGGFLERLPMRIGRRTPSCFT